MGNTGSKRLCDFSWAHGGAAQSASAPNPAVAAPAEQSKKEVKKKKPKKGKRTQVSATQSKPALPRSEAKKPSAKPPNKVHPSMPRHVSMPVHRPKPAAAETKHKPKRTMSWAVSAKPLTVNDFSVKRVIGKGGFAEVRVVQRKDTGNIYAMKILNKQRMVKMRQVKNVKSERDFLTLANNPWVVKLYDSFQDAQNLYLVMEYIPGGDLMSILQARDILPEREAAFYMAEVATAIRSVHELGFAHRDLKPDNVLIDRDGHIKLSDFGLSKQTGTAMPADVLSDSDQDELPRSMSFKEPSDARDTYRSFRAGRRGSLVRSMVGTPDYMAPEIFFQTGYGKEVDYWSLGVLCFECLAGYPPFFANDTRKATKKITNWKKNLKFPTDVHISDLARDFIRGLLTSADKRLTWEQIREHKWFASNGVKFDNLREMKAPFLPNLKHNADTSHFDKFKADIKLPTKYKPRAKDHQGPFKGFTYKRPRDDEHMSGPEM